MNLHKYKKSARPVCGHELVSVTEDRQLAEQHSRHKVRLCGLLLILPAALISSNLHLT